jgi:hypothetical protein
MERTPPRVKKQLRKEQGFVCAVPGCTNPYLWYHHFDPPWHVEHHQRPEGIIGLCGIHHPPADHGAFTVDQLREYKQAAAEEAPTVRGQFHWLRQKMVLVSGGWFFVENRVDVQVNGRPAVWFNRDDEGHALLNVRMPPSGPSRRVVIEDNSWVEVGNAKDLVAPPGGKSLEVSYANGDHLGVKFAPIQNVEELEKRYPGAGKVGLALPMTFVDVVLKVPALGIDIDTGRTQGSKVTNGVLERGGVGLAINMRRSRGASF